MKLSTKILGIFLFLFLTLQVAAQQIVALHPNYTQLVDFETGSKQCNFITVMKPYRYDLLAEHTDCDSLFAFGRVKKHKNWFLRKLREESFLAIDTLGFQLQIDPLAYLELGNQLNTSSHVWTNTRAVRMQGRIGEKLTFQSFFFENQANMPQFIDDFVKKYNIIPGQGMSRGFHTDSYDFSRSEGWISYSPSSVFNFQFGHGKRFIGDGYRSLLLSDNSFSYPFFQITTRIWNIQYVNLFTAFSNMKTSNYWISGYDKKYGSFHILSYYNNLGFEISLFEGIVWHGGDSTANRGFDVNYLNPIIFYRPVEFSLGSPDNAILGANLKYKLLNNLQLYSQLVLDDIDFGESQKGKGYLWNKFGFQFGGKYFDAFGISNLFLQLEYNRVRPYTYSHRSDIQSYSHYRQPLAHPLGANFEEFIALANYKLGDFQLSLKANFAIYGADNDTTNWGGNIFLIEQTASLGYPSWGNFTKQGFYTELLNFKAEIVYLLNPVTNLNIFTMLYFRKLDNNISPSTDKIFTFGIRTSIENFYYDF